MVNKREIILQTINTLLSTALTVPVYRLRAYTLDQNQLPAIDVHWQQESSLDDGSAAFLDRELLVMIRCFASDSATQSADAILNQLCVEVTQALTASSTLGLNFVIDSEEGTHTTEVSGEASVNFSYTTIEWRILYRRARPDPSQ